MKGSTFESYHCNSLVIFSNTYGLKTLTAEQSIIFKDKIATKLKIIFVSAMLTISGYKSCQASIIYKVAYQADSILEFS